MKLIKTLDSRLESATAKPGQTKRFGLFECPVCKEHVEKPLTKGKRNKTCGKQECRKAALQYNYEGNYQSAASKRGEIEISTLPYYNHLKSMYLRLKQYGRITHETINTLNKFVNVVHEDYMEIKRATGSSKLVIVPLDKNKELSNTNYLVGSKDEDYILDTELGVYTTRKLEHITGKKHESVMSSLRIRNISKTEMICITAGGHKLKNYMLSEEDYETLLNVLQNGREGINTELTHLYLFDCVGYTKIGVTKDINKRLAALRCGNPFKISLLVSNTIGMYSTGVESYLHRKYEEYNLHDEWFSIPSNELSSLIKDINSLKVVEEYKDYLNKKHLDKLSNMLDAEYTRKETYQKMLENNRQANVKPEIDVIVNEDREEYVNDRSAQIEATTKHGMIGTPIYKEWRRLVNHELEDVWRSSEIFIPTMTKEFTEFEGNPRIVGKVAGAIGPNNYKIIDVKDVPIVSGVTRGVVQLDNEGNEIARFESAADAARVVPGVTAGKIPAVCKGTRKSHAGFKWTYTE